MSGVILLFLAGILLEISVYYFVLHNKTLAIRAAIMTLLLFALFAVYAALRCHLIIGLLIVYILIFKSINLARVVLFRRQRNELFERCVRSSALLNIGLLILVLFTATETAGIVTSVPFSFVIALSALGSMTLFVTTVRSILRWRYIAHGSDVNTPTVTLCIPARNETAQLAACLESALSSRYKKLEILVLDDCSHDKTPEIIKKYAHDGVRFISGEEPKTGWIAKNAAMQKLLDEARGEILLFSGVDVLFEENSIEELVNQLMYHKMVGVLPNRNQTSEMGTFIQPIRYWWELSVPRVLSGRPPVLSTLWGIHKKTLVDMGGFAGVRRSVQPEAHFAKRLKANYRLTVSNSELGISSTKSPRDQYNTALRVRYPQLKHRPETVAFTIAIEYIIFITPVMSILYGMATNRELYIFVGGWIILLLLLTNTIITALTMKRFKLIGLLSTPFLLFFEWYVLVKSMLAYEFGEVNWKERNVCLPMLEVERSLPKV